MAGWPKHPQTDGSRINKNGPPKFFQKLRYESFTKVNGAMVLLTPATVSFWAAECSDFLPHPVPAREILESLHRIVHIPAQ